MARRRRHDGGGHGEAGGGMERWLLTYADMITLLLALFIVLFAMSTIDIVRFDSLKRTLAQSFRGQVLAEPGAITDGSESVLDPNAASEAQPQAAFQIQDDPTSVASTAAASAVARSFSREQANLERTIRRLESQFSGLKGKLEVVSNERGIVIRLAGDTFFESGSAEIRPELREALLPIARDIYKERRQASVEGHTDGAPINTALFPDNLALSQARAASVFRFLVDVGIAPTKLRAVGYGEWRPIQPPKDNPKASIARNRRVEIVILAPGGNLARATNAAPTYRAKVSAPSRASGNQGKGGGSSTTPSSSIIGEIIPPIL